MPEELHDVFVAIEDEDGRLSAIMDRTMADYLESEAPHPTQQSIDSLLRYITRVRVVPLSNHLLGATEIKTLLDTTDPTSLASFRECFAIDEDPTTFGHCMCLGDPHIELYAGDSLVAIIRYHHGDAIRWDAWRDDAQLKEPDRLLEWMSTHGVDGPQHEVNETKQRREQERREEEWWLEAMPKCFCPFWERMKRLEDSTLNGLMLEEALEVAIPAPEEQALALFGWFGSPKSPWFEFRQYEFLPMHLLDRYPNQFLIDVLTVLSPTEAQLRGAARYFALENHQRKEIWGRGIHPTKLKLRLLHVVRIIVGKFLPQKKVHSARLPASLKRRLLDVARNSGLANNVDLAERVFNA